MLSINNDTGMLCNRNAQRCDQNKKCFSWSHWCPMTSCTAFENVKNLRNIGISIDFFKISPQIIVILFHRYLIVFKFSWHYYIKISSLQYKNSLCKHLNKKMAKILCWEKKSLNRRRLTSNFCSSNSIHNAKRKKVTRLVW